MKKNSLLMGVFVALLTLALAAPAVFASSDKDKDKDEDEPKVTICHFPPGSPENAQTLSVGASAVDAHLSEHGDTLGACPEEDKDDESKDKDDESKDKDDESKDKDDESKDDGAKDEDEGKTTICHDGTNTLSVDDSAVAGHLGHGDYLGECTCACPPGAASCVCADGEPGVTSPASLTPPASQRDIRGQ